jgi:hypothetical protein
MLRKSGRVPFQSPKAGRPCRGRVLLNWSSDRERDLDRIARSYHSAARDLLEALKSTRPCGLVVGDDFAAYPIIFLYRQTLELTLKAIVGTGSDLFEDEGDPVPFKRTTTHTLTPLFKEALRILGRLPSDISEDSDLKEPRVRTEAEAIVREFDFFDRGSHTFRYPTRKDGSRPLERNFEFDLFAFAATMEGIISTLFDLPELIRRTIRERWEDAYEDQEDPWARGHF